MFLIDLVQQLNLLEYINRGGFIVYILIALNILGFSIMLWKFLVMTVAKFRKEATAIKIVKIIENSNRKYEEKTFRNALDKYLTGLESGLNTVKIIASISPLLGLLGTVIGVLNSFDSISKSGLGDPTIFSTGISIALITTVAGLIVAIPHYIGYNYLIAFIDNLEHKIEERVISKLWEKRRETIVPDLTPLIDVVFILLIFFIVSSVFKKEELVLILDLPSSSAQELEIKPKEITLEISTGKFAIYGKEVSIEELEKKLSEVTNKKNNVIVRIDKNVVYERVVSVLDILQKYDLNNLSLVTKKDDY